MSSMKKRARDVVTGKFSRASNMRGSVTSLNAEVAACASAAEGIPKSIGHQLQEDTPKKARGKRAVGRPRVRAMKPPKETKLFELSIIVSVGGADIDVCLMDRLASFLQKETLAGKCSLERGAAAYHLHFQMVARILSFSMVAVSRMVKTYIGWDASKPVGGIVICKALSQRGIHTFIGMLGYCMKDVEEEHFRTVDHNISAEELKAGLEQLALHGQEESKRKILLNQRNFALKCQSWKRWNYCHPAVLDWETEFFRMMKSGKFYPCTSWVVGGYGRGYDVNRMQSYWKMLQAPTTITMDDMRNVFSPPESGSHPTRMEWFDSRWNKPPATACHAQPARPQLSHSGVVDAERAAEDAKRKLMMLQQEIEDIDRVFAQSIQQPDEWHQDRPVSMGLGTGHGQNDSGLRGVDIEKAVPLCAELAPGMTSTKAKAIRDGKRKESPLRGLWPVEWRVYANNSSQSTSHSIYQPVLGEDVYIPIYKRMKPAVVID